MELRVIGFFRSHRVPITVSVIPFVSAHCLDPLPHPTIRLTDAKGNVLRQELVNGLLDVVLHGYSHQTYKADELTEFAGIPYDIQVRKIAEGKEFLESIIGRRIEVFVPPWNRYDVNTLRALQEQQFKLISADHRGDTLEGASLRFLPATCDLLWIREAIEAARDACQPEPIIVVLFHSYDFREVNPSGGRTDYDSLCNLLKWLTSQRDLRLLSLSEANQAIADLSTGRYLAWKSRRSGAY